MSKGRLEAFSDGMFSIFITIMVLELKVPHGVELAVLEPLLPALLTYVLSFIYLAIYWNNHHHLFHAAKHVAGGILWANLHLLFWLSLFPFATGWLGENHLASTPSAAYGAVLFMAGVSYYILQRVIIAHHGAGSLLAIAIGSDWKGKLSLVLLAVAIPVSFAIPWIAITIYMLVAFLWFIPDRRIERVVAQAQ